MSSFQFKDLHELIPGSKYFKWNEALYLPRMQAYARPALSNQANICKVAMALDRVREHFGKPITINSWLRPLEYNKLIGGAPQSAHIQGLAVDFTVAGVSPQVVTQTLAKDKSLWPGRIELDAITWTHADLMGDQNFMGYPTRKTL